MLDDAFKDMFLSKLEAMCPAPTFKAIKPRDIDDLITRYWDFDMKMNYAGPGQDLTINLPVEFVGSKGRRARRMDDPHATNTRMVITRYEPPTSRLNIPANGSKAMIWHRFLTPLSRELWP